MTFEAGPANSQPFSGPMALVPSFDVIEVLPPKGADRLRALRQHVQDLRALTVPFETIQEASISRQRAAQNLKRLLHHQHDNGFGLDPTDGRVVEAQRQLDALTDDFKRLNELNETRKAALREASHVLSAVEGWLKDGRPPGTVLEDFSGPEPKLNKGESLIDAIERLRRRGRELRADIHRVRSACYTKAEAMALLRTMVESWGSNGIDTSVTIEHLSQPTIPTKTVQAMVHNVPGAPAAVVFVEVPDVIGIFSTVLKDQFIAWLAADVDRNADPKGALSHEARQQQEAELMRDLLAVERDESFFVWQAMDQGLPATHRSDCAPQAILQCALTTAPAAVNGRGTSAQHAFDIVGRR